MTDKPKVSVLMTAYNRESFIEEAIVSVLDSTFRNFELIISDDGSTDRTLEIAEEYAARDSRIRLNVNSKNLGDYPHRNHIATLAKGEYILYLDSDDKILTDGIEKLVTIMEAFPKASIGMYSIRKGEPFQLSSDEAIYSHFFKEPFLMMGPGGTIQRLNFFRQIGGYPEKYGPANDMYYNLKACCYSPIVLLPFEFMTYRRHDGQEINNTSSYLYNTYLYLKDAAKDLPLPLFDKQKRWIENKNKRRFTVNMFKRLLRFEFRNVSSALRKTNFTVKDFLEAIFH